MKYCHKNKGLQIHAYCIMTSHVHLILSTEEGNALSDVIRDFKSFTSTKLKSCIKENSDESRREWLIWMFERAGKKNKRNSGFQLWQQHNHPIEPSNNTLMDQRLTYIHNNPVEAGFVDEPQTCAWSSCRSYETGVEDIVPLYYIQ
ncbi:transposase [Fulvivirga kasyanovii]|uniref:transposase n=1 Tax=Fulvivirga kasyanovii TaxID=396812 RepID=UPI001FECA6C8|nr:transposase [Fulvivirga kasyanovii]